MNNSRLLITMLFILGLWSTTRISDSWYKPYYRYYKSFLNSTLVYSFILLQFLEFILNENMENADEDLKLLITEICYLAKSLNLFYHLELAVELLHEWEISDSFNLRSSAERDMWLRGERTFRKVINIYIFFCLLTVFLAIGSTTLSGTPTLLYQFWLPAKWREYNIWPAFFYESLSLNFNCMCNVVLDSFQCYLLYHLSLYTRLIGMRMERLGYEKTNVETTRALDNIIDMHQRLKAMTRCCEKILSVPLLTQITLSAFTICFSIYSLRSLSFIEHPMSLLSAVMYLLCMSIQIFMPCYFANNLTAESQNLSSHLYNCNWVDLSVYNRRQIFLYMEYLKLPLFVYAGNYFKVGLLVFTKIMNNAYSLVALLNNINNDDQ